MATGTHSKANSLFSIPARPADKIFGLNRRFQADPSSHKVNLGIGVFRDESGKRIPTFAAVSKAAAKIAATNPDAGYLAPIGHDGFIKQVTNLVFEGHLNPVTEKRVLTAQTVGGTGGIRVAAELLKVCLLERSAPLNIYVSNPTWENHNNIFQRTGFQVKEYPYYDLKSGRFDYEVMKSFLQNQIPNGSVVLLHACCHNPTGSDIPASCWEEVASIFKSKGLIPFFDFAYHGFGDGLQEDKLSIMTFIKAGLPLFMAYSCSKNFSFYNERLGAAIVVVDDSSVIPQVQSQLEPIIRGSYSNCPAHGARIFAEVVADPVLRAEWEQELGEMRVRIKSMRNGLIDGLCASGLDWAHIKENRGMFSYLPMSSEQIEKLISKHHVYGLDSGGACRINVAAITRESMPLIVEAIVDSMR